MGISLSDRTTQADLDWWFDTAARLEWIWAKTYAQSAPHDYVVLGRSAGMAREDFIRAGRVIRTFGVPGKFWSYTNIYLTSLDGRLKWWTMDAVADDTDLINRATTDRTYGPQEVHQTATTTFTPWDEVSAVWDRVRDTDRDAEIRDRIVVEFGDWQPCVLDVGCGTGALLDMGVLDPGRYTGIDSSQGMLNGLVLKHPTVGRVIPARFEDVDTADLAESYDLVVAQGVPDLDIDRLGGLASRLLIVA